MPKQLNKKLEFDAIASYLTNLAHKVQPFEIGDPVYLSPVAFEAMIDRLRHYRENYPAMSFWYVVNIKNNAFTAMEGLAEVFGERIDNRIDFFRFIHPDYFKPYFHWVSACYDLTLKLKNKLQPLSGSFRISIPLLHKDGFYYWYSQHTTITQQDVEGFIVTYLNAYYMEEKWSALILKPFEAQLQLRDGADTENEKALFAIMAPYIIDEFTNSELQLINLFATGMNGNAVAEKIGWSRHTLNEYNVTILKKARRIFQYNFRSAREFARYCLEKGFIYKR